MGKYFGTDGVRGVANSELTPELAFKLGRFGGYVLTKSSKDNPKVLIGRDTRISGEMLEGALAAGLLSVGAEVMRLGVSGPNEVLPFCSRGSPTVDVAVFDWAGLPLRPSFAAPWLGSQLGLQAVLDFWT